LLTTTLLVAAVPAAATAPPTTTAYSNPVAVYPSPGDKYEQPRTQITFRGIPASEIGTVTVTGSKTGAHTGQIESDSDGDGGSFIPSKPFTPGETVTVRTGLNILGGSSGSFSFQIEHPGAVLQPEELPDATGPNSIQRFHSAPDLQPAALKVTENKAPATDGDFFVAPQFGPAQDGPEILDPQGNLVWYDPYPMARNELVTDFREQELGGQPVLTWFEGTTASGTGSGDGVIVNDHYQRIATVHAGNGLSMDLHEFYVTNNGDAYIIAVTPVMLPGLHRAVLNPVIQEIDIATGLVLFQWDALDHISTSMSYLYGPKQPGHVLDPFHANSISFDSAGNPVVSLRNTDAVYDIDRSTGQILWELGGKKSSFKMGSGTTTAFQHDAVMQPNGDITIFDDGAGPPKVHQYSRGIEVALNTSNHTATLVKQFAHSPQLSANFEGSVQSLPSGDFVLGWGQQPYFSEVNSAGQQIFDAHWVTGTASYRAYRFAWTGQPNTPPALALGTTSSGDLTAWESWNGATAVTGWRVLAGTSATTLSGIGSYAKHKFESSLTPGTGDPYVQVQALGAGGATLASTAVERAPSHVQIFGGRDFVPSNGLTSVPVGCYSSKPCHLSATVTAGGQVVARSGSEGFAAGTAGLLYFRLSPSARAQIASGSHSLGVSITVRDSSGAHSATAGQVLVGFTTSGGGPTRTFSSSAQLKIVAGTDFVNGSTGEGSTLAECQTATPCRVSATVTVGGKVIAQSTPEYIGANQLGYVYFQLSSAGKTELAHAGGNQLGAQVQLTGSGLQAGADTALVAFS
jgi:hypothetical protein